MQKACVRFTASLVLFFVSEDLLKWLMAAGLLFLALAGGLLPARIRAQKKMAQWLSLGNALAGGIFLGVALLHMLPHAMEEFSHGGHAGHEGESHFPWAIFIAAAGFLLILFIEKVVPRRQDFDETRMVDEVLGGGHHHHSIQHVSHPMVLLVALSIHAFFAGLALGSSHHVGDVFSISLGMAAHKLMESFALGVTLAKSPFSQKLTFQLIGLFALVTPIGVILGSLLTHSEHGHGIVGASLSSLAAGTFIYIATMDILPECFHDANRRIAKFILVVLGLGAMALISH